MNEVVTSVHVFHIVAGFLAFIVAPAAMATAKGGPAHRRWDQLYFWAMAAVAASAVVLALWRPVEWLALLAIFSFYSAFSGYSGALPQAPPRGGGGERMGLARRDRRARRQPRAVRARHRAPERDGDAHLDDRYVATVSAFSAVNFTFLPLTARFLWPSMVGVPLIFAWVAYYRARFSRRAARAVPA